jgi:type VI secretion system secreted protein Hcp
MAVDMFITIGDIKGESKDDKHKDEIDVLAWSWGLSNSGSMSGGGGGGAGKANVQDVSFTKYMDKSSPNLMMYCCSGKHFDKALLTVRKAGDKPLEYLKLTLEDVLITSVSTGGSGGEDRLTENVSLNFAKYKLSYQPQAKDGGPDGGSIDGGWNVEANVKY